MEPDGSRDATEDHGRGGHHHHHRHHHHHNHHRDGQRQVGHRTRQEQPGKRVVAVAIDPDSSISTPEMMSTLASLLVRDADSVIVHVVSVLPIASDAPPPGNGAYASTEDDFTGTVAKEWARQKEQMRLAADTAIAATTQQLRLQVKGDVTTASRVLDPKGGVSAAGSALVAFAEEVGASVVVVGSRGHGAIKRGLLAMAGLGSVSEYCLKHSHCPVMIVKPRLPEQQPMNRLPDMETEGPARICIAVDSTEHSRQMLQWAVSHLLSDSVVAHLLTVSLERTRKSGGLVSCLNPAAAVAEADEDAMSVSPAEADSILQKAKQLVVGHGIAEDQVETKVLQPSGGLSHIGSEIAGYINANRFACAIVGRREEHGLKK